MERQLSRFPELEAEFIPAVEGRKMSEEELSQAFDRETSRAYYGRDLTRGEVGCTLSHVRCYNHIAAAGDEVALILEDDADLGTELPDFSPLERLLSGTERPMVVLLSGHYWYWPGFRRSLKRVFCAYYTHSYLINRSAARLLAARFRRPFHLADNWLHIHRQGVQVLAVRPHWINQISTDETSTVGVNLSLVGSRGLVKRNLSVFRRMESYYEGAVRKILKCIGCYEND
jgi:glycosyl transferase family 25